MATKLITIDGQRYTLGELSKKYNINVKTLEFRYRQGTRDESIVKPVERHKHIMFKGERVNFYQLADQYGLSVGILRNRYYKQNDRDDDLVRPKGTPSSKNKSSKEIIFDRLHQDTDLMPILKKVERKEDLTGSEEDKYWRAYRREYGRLYRQRNKKSMPEYWRKYYKKHNHYKRHERTYHKNGQMLTRHAKYFSNYYHKSQANRDHVNDAVRNYRRNHPERVHSWSGRK